MFSIIIKHTNTLNSLEDNIQSLKDMNLDYLREVIAKMELILEMAREGEQKLINHLDKVFYL